MSSFEGLMNEYRFASIDKFDGKNLSSRMYFLSHCHTDHMVGLDRAEFHQRLRNNPDIRLYCSQVTRALLISDKKYQHLADYVTSLPVEEPMILGLENGEERETVSVTLLSASHCPGSVMFLFEGREGIVLYTGDFRLPKGSAKRIKEFQGKEIESMYVDTTFCIPEAMYIPTRERCLEQLIKLCSEWLVEDNSHVVRLNLSAKYGYEYLYHALHDKFNSKIYCKRKDMYSCLPDTYKILTRKSNRARIFACFKKERIDKHNSDREVEAPEKIKFLNITLSTMFFTYKAEPWEVCRKEGKHHYRMCFSFHSSNAEVCDFVKFVRPRQVYANVIPKNFSTLDEVSESLRRDCGLPTVKVEEYNTLGKIDFNFCNREPVKRKKAVLSLDEDSLESLDLVTNLSPPRPKIQRARCTSEDGFKNVCDNDDDLFVPVSPGTLEPSSSDIDLLHVDLAEKYGARKIEK